MALIKFTAPTKANTYAPAVAEAILATFGREASTAEDGTAIEAVEGDRNTADEYIVPTAEASKIIAAYQTAAVEAGYTARRRVNEVVKDDKGKDTSETRLVFQIVPKQRVGETRAPRTPKDDAPTAE